MTWGTMCGSRKNNVYTILNVIIYICDLILLKTKQLFSYFLVANAINMNIVKLVETIC